jgi:hypothetical protein
MSEQILSFNKEEPVELPSHLLEEGEVYTFVFGTKDVIGKLLSCDNESGAMIIENAMSFIMVQGNNLAPMPFDKFGQQLHFVMHFFNADVYWKTSGDALEGFNSYVAARTQQRLADKAGIEVVNANALNRLNAGKK